MMDLPDDLNADQRKRATSSEPPRRDQALAFIIEQIARWGISPSYDEIGRALAVSKARATQLVAQLIRAGHIEKTPGAQRSLRVLDLAHSRTLLDQSLRNLGWIAADPLGPLVQTFPEGQLPVLPAFEHYPDAANGRGDSDVGNG